VSLWWLLTTAIKPLPDVLVFPPPLWPTRLRLENILEVFEFGPFLLQFWNSVYIGLVVAIGTVVFSILAGYAFARMHFPGRDVLFVGFLAAQVMPLEALIIPMFQIVRALGWTDSQLPLMVFEIFGRDGAIATFVMRQFFITIPSELEDAGRVDGLGKAGVLWYVMLPLARPAVAAIAVVSFLFSWNEFLMPLIFIQDTHLQTIPVALVTYTDPAGFPIWNLQLAATAISLLPVVIVFAIMQRQVVQTFMGSGLKG